MFRRTSDPPQVIDTGEDLGSLIERADDDARLHAVVGRVLQNAVHRQVSTTPFDSGGGFASADPLDNVQTPVGVPLAPADYEPPPATYIAPSPCDVAGYVAFTARGTYAARQYLKRLGGYWDAKRKRWLVPRSHGKYCAAIIEQAEMGRLPGADPGYRSGGTPKRLTEGLRCWICGTAYPEVEFRARPGARAEDWYCGCASSVTKDTRRFRR